MAGLKSQEAAGILEPDGSGKLTKTAKRNFTKDVKRILATGIPNIDPGKVICFKIPPVLGAEDLDLDNEFLYPDYHKNILGLYESVAKSLNTDSDFKFLPICDPLAFGLKLGIDFGINIELPPDLPGISAKLAIELAKPEIALKLPNLGLKFPPDLPPSIPLPKLDLPKIDLPSLDFDINFALGAAFKLVLLKLPDLFVNIALNIPIKLPNFPDLGLCDAFKEAFKDGVEKDPAFVLDPVPGVAAASMIVLLQKTANCMVYGAIGATLGASPSGFVGAIARTNGETPAGEEPPVDNYAGKSLLAVRGLQSTSTDFLKRVVDIAQELNPSRAQDFGDWLVTCMSQETAGTFNPQIRPNTRVYPGNPSQAIGLIGLIESSRKLMNAAMGTNYTVDSMFSMTATEQLDVVRTYFKFVAQTRNKTPEELYTSLERTYLAVFAPSFVSSPMNTVAYKKGSPEYGPPDGPNAAVDKNYGNNDGEITVGEIAAAIRGAYNYARGKRIYVTDGTMA